MNSKMDFVFVILRSMQKQWQTVLWKRCYLSIRKFHPTTRIIIIDDNSSIKEDINIDATVIVSSFPGAGELLPYYYFHKERWASKMIFLHDTMVVVAPFTEKDLEYEYRYLWHFPEHTHDDNEQINKYIDIMPNNYELYKLNKSKIWDGCFGVSAMISLSFLDIIEDKYKLSSILPHVKNRGQRIATERLFAILCYAEKPEAQPSYFGNIDIYPGAWGGASYEQQMANLHIYLPGTRVLKSWAGR